MRLAYWVLRPAQRQAIREMARQAYLDAGGDKEKAILLAHERSKDLVAGGIVLTIFIGIVVKLAVELILYWFALEVLDPPLAYQVGEPGCPSEDEPNA